MAYSVYTSEAVVLKKRDVGEADRSFSVFTKNFGRIEAFSRGVRLLKSKLRYNLSHPAVLRLSFIPTQNGLWRIIDAEEIKVLRNTKLDSAKFQCVLKFFALLERLLQGQEEDAALWKETRDFLEKIEEEKYGAEDINDFFVYTGLKILGHMGYADRNVYSGDFSLKDVRPNRKFFVDSFKRGLENSHL
ncbi:MAG: DNA repair protein RecO [Candidatus Pacebacteria bacterium]|nr:DNA repair protein RecO [Candidatus Paceibacterota bacterium]